METKEFRKHYLRIKRKNEAIAFKDNNKNALERMFAHETLGTLQNQVEGYSEIYREGLIEYSEFKGVIENLKQDMPKYLTLEKLTEVDFTKEGLRDNSQLDMYNLFDRERKSLEGKYNLKVNIQGHAYQNINEAALTALVSTHMGDAAKWTPEGESINIQLSQDSNNTKITIENPAANQEIRSEFGLGQQIGTKYTKAFLDTLNGTTSQTSFENQNGQKIFKKEFYIPKK